MIVDAAFKARFWAKVDKCGPTQPHMSTPCWLWTASTFKDGYGKCWFNSSSHPAQRIAWLIKTGTMPKPFALHRCDVPGCVRFSHLFEGDAVTNNRDCLAKGRKAVFPGDTNPSRRRPECLPRGEAHVLSKLTSAEVIEMRRLYAAGGVKQVDLASYFRISKAVTCLILNRKLWRHL